MVTAKFKKIHPNAVLPKYQSDQAAGFDFHAALDAPVVINPGDRALIATGLSVELPRGTELQVRSRSGLALKNAVVVLNSPGTVDADYRGPIGVILINHSTTHAFTINNGDRIAQGVITSVLYAQIEEAVELSETERGAGGFGSTGVK